MGEATEPVIDGIELSRLTPTPHREPIPASEVTRRPAPERPNLWTILREALGTDITRITLPVYFNEPLSFLQRLAEDVEYSALLDVAAAAPLAGTPRRLALVAAFVVSHYASTAGRPNKPFNPLLGETFELVRTKRGRAHQAGGNDSNSNSNSDGNGACNGSTNAVANGVAASPAGGSNDRGDANGDDEEGRELVVLAEQVSHHPPVSALHAVGRGWVYHTSHQVRSKFHANSLEVWPEGAVHVRFADGDHYVYDQAHTFVNNVILGDLTIDNGGTIVIRDVGRGRYMAKVELKRASSSLSTGALFRTWTSSSSSGGGGGGGGGKSSGEVVGKVFELRKKSSSSAPSISTSSPSAEGKTIHRLSGSWKSEVKVDGETVWRVKPRPTLRMCTGGYPLTRWAWAMNAEQEAGGCWRAAKTDSRLRPDQRALEQGRYRDAAALKEALENRQRQRQKALGGGAAPGTAPQHTPQWFELVDSDAGGGGGGAKEWRYRGGYFEQRVAAAPGGRDGGGDADGVDIFAV